MRSNEGCCENDDNTSCELSDSLVGSFMLIFACCLSNKFI